jgi:hypothetical protein
VNAQVFGRVRLREKEFDLREITITADTLAVARV